MAVRGSAKRYAQAVFEIARERESFDQWRSDLAELAGLSQDQGLMGVIESPRVPLETKRGLLEDRLPGVSREARNLARLLVARRRFELGPRILEEYQRRLDAHRGIEHAHAVTAVALDPQEQQELARWLGERLGKQVVLTADVDTTILGGLVLRLGDKLVDGSTRSQLQALQRELAGAP